jgi:GTPase
MDMPEAQERWPKVKAELEKHGYEPLAISALAQQNLQPLLWRAHELLETAPAPEPAAREIPVYRPEEDPRTFTIERTDDGGYRVRGQSIERAAAMTYWEEHAAVLRFHRLIETLGIDKELRKAGIQEGDTVYIGDYELEWAD